MIGGAISTTHRRLINPAVQFISLETQPTALSRALPLGLANPSSSLRRGTSA
jgi:hypothetical protein